MILDKVDKLQIVCVLSLKFQLIGSLSLTFSLKRLKKFKLSSNLASHDSKYGQYNNGTGFHLLTSYFKLAHRVQFLCD